MRKVLVSDVSGHISKILDDDELKHEIQKSMKKENNEKQQQNQNQDSKS